jgi:hypothetical protein
LSLQNFFRHLHIQMNQKNEEYKKENFQMNLLELPNY